MRLGKKGFTLIELLVVISIIGLLSAALIIVARRGVDVANAMKCKTNLKNLGQATLNQVVLGGGFPQACSYEIVKIDASSGDAVYTESRGWVGWTGSGEWPNTDSQADQMQKPGFCGELAYDSLTNGTFWGLAGKDATSYICSTHKKAAETEGETDIWRSYVMNYRFVGRWYRNEDGSDFEGPRFWKLTQLTSNDRMAATVLLFAALPANDIDTSEAAGDGKVDPSNNEHIGFNHPAGKRNVAHVVYADGHVGLLLEPSGADSQDMVDLTEQICRGDGIDQDLINKMH